MKPKRKNQHPAILNRKEIAAFNKRYNERFRPQQPSLGRLQFGKDTHPKEDQK
jgi:hypothetical protein